MVLNFQQDSISTTESVATNTQPVRSYSPSSTAALIARSLILLARTPHLAGLVDAKDLSLALACLHAADGHARRWWRWCGWPWFRAALRGCEQVSIPGIVRHYALRKHIIAAHVEQALAEGADGLAVLAAGYDALAWKTSAQQTLTWVVEVDHPATQRVKHQAMGVAGSPMDWLSADLGTALGMEAVRTRLELHPGKMIVVMEGFLMYVQVAHVRTILSQLAAAILPGSWLIFTVMDCEFRPRPAFRRSHPLIDLWLAWKDEPFRWGTTRQAIKRLLSECGFYLSGLHGAASFPRLAGCPSMRPGAEGEWVVVARRVGDPCSK